MQDYHWKKKKKNNKHTKLLSPTQKKKKNIFIFDFWNGKTFFIKKGLEMICMGPIGFFFFFFEKFYFENWKQRWLKWFLFTWHLRSWVQTFKRWVAGQILGWVLGPLRANGGAPFGNGHLYIGITDDGWALKLSIFNAI